MVHKPSIVGRWFLLVLAFALLPSAFAVEKNYVTGKVIALEERTRERVKMYVANTPIMSEDPYWTITVEVNGTRYVGEFLPATSQHELSAGTWRAEDAVQIRLEKKFFYLRRENGSDAKFVIIHKEHSSA